MFAALFLTISFTQLVLGSDITYARSNHRLFELNDNQLEYIAGLSDTKHIDRILDNILIPRVVGTPNHAKVRNYILNELQSLGFTTEIDEFIDHTPNMGKLKFKNIIGTLNPNADRYLVLGCHYDSKYFKDNKFVGATDSAVPCAMMLNLAKVLANELDDKKDDDGTSLMLLFLDGEEAFQTWSSTDSIYGARHLAEKWHRSVGQTKSYGDINQLEKIDVFVLLDLLGTPDPTFFSYFPKTNNLYVRMSDAEDRLARLNLLEKYSKNRNQKYFKKRSTTSYVEDDHIPFMLRGVPILHLIPREFPKGWHTNDDNRDSIDMGTVENLNKIIRTFVAEYLHLSIPNDQTNPRPNKAEL